MTPAPYRPGSEAARARVRARLARAHQRGDTDRIAILQRALQVERVADRIAEIVATAPPLTDQQYAALALALGGYRGSGTTVQLDAARRAKRRRSPREH